MKSTLFSTLATAFVFGGGLIGAAAQAETQSVFYQHLNSTAVIANPLLANDTLFIDTFTPERGALRQITTFTVGAGVTSFTGHAAWLVSTPADAGPRLVGVNIDLFDTSNTLIQSDSFAGVLAGFAHSTISGLLGPGTYTLVATGTGQRDSSLDISLTLAVPEPATYTMLLAGLGIVGYALRRRIGRGSAGAAPQS
ncbi:FxDxF family PEP-CTERM protein [Janthinobacterium fluminis]|uniref:FxDxF family PEP-CTERM protein n=1 Tax=Janthinobacterium fluminis TaxID=2987524 RepID=A0ABT5JY75_9BURK|nr:FxDxF family PEP-CTERM protein [Janthinobacterium fluminis]MDC8757688.1 FxDxF family PEP-CTERM protein [Janthinobacterium fluminis]